MYLVDTNIIISHLLLWIVFHLIFLKPISGIIDPNGEGKATLFQCMLELQMGIVEIFILCLIKIFAKKIKSNEIMMVFSNDIVYKILIGVKGESRT
jgi:hypothetical protein